MGCWGGVTGLGVWHDIWWMHKYCLLQDIGSLDHTDSSSSAVGKSSCYMSESISNEGFSLKLLQAAWWGDNSSLVHPDEGMGPCGEDMESCVPL